MRAIFLTAMAAVAALVAGCAGEGGNEASNASAAVTPAVNQMEKEEPRDERNETAAEPADRPLPDFASFRISDEQREARLSRTYNGCMEAAGTTADYRDCSSAEFQRIEQEMERALERAREGLSESGRERLAADQRRWREGLPDLCQRELEEEGAEGGSMDLLTLDACSLREAVRRTLWLESLG